MSIDTPQQQEEPPHIRAQAPAPQEPVWRGQDSTEEQAPSEGSQAKEQA